MNDSFEKKVRAAVAGWWVVLIAVGFLRRASWYDSRAPYYRAKQTG
jgi:hypothetical protein